jgi:hypothetical protein
LLAKYGQKVVVLIDEYDKPLLDNIEKPEVQAEIRDGLRDFYSIIKEQDANLQFVFLTGVDRQLLKFWYNGYNFLGEPVYNPFDILLFINEGQSYRNYWFETGTPTFLMRLFQQRRYFLPDLEGLEVGEEILSSFELDRIEPATLLFQTGYLTFKAVETVMGQLSFRLGFPNFEVKSSFCKYLITTYTDIGAEKLRYEKALYHSLLSADLPALEQAIRRLFAAISYRNFTKNDIAGFEGY